MSLSNNKHREASLHTPLPQAPVRVRTGDRNAIKLTQTRPVPDAKSVSSRQNNQRLVSPRDMLPPRVLAVHTAERSEAKQTLSVSRRQPKDTVHAEDKDRPVYVDVRQRAHYSTGGTGSLRSPLQSTTLVVTTPIGQFEIPNYNLMTHIEIARERSSYETKFKQINEDWKHLGVSFKIPTRDEDIGNIAIRYQETEKHLSTKTGSDFWFIILCVGWALGAKVMAYYQMPVDGYVESQVANYKMYQSQLIRMGTTSGFGTEWSPWMQVLITSCANLVLMVILSKLAPGAKSCAPTIMREISGVITGNNTVETSETGTPLPNTGGMMSALTSALGGGGDEGGGGGGMMSAISGLMGMFGGGGGGTKKKKKRSKKAKIESAEKRRAPSEISFD